jgi:hypothetical protein
MTGFFEVQDLRSVTVQFQFTSGGHIHFMLGEMVNGVYTAGAHIRHLFGSTYAPL